jgi:hypothetical protein
LRAQFEESFLGRRPLRAGLAAKIRQEPPDFLFEIRRRLGRPGRYSRYLRQNGRQHRRQRQKGHQPQHVPHEGSRKNRPTRHVSFETDALFDLYFQCCT